MSSSTFRTQWTQIPGQFSEPLPLNCVLNADHFEDNLTKNEASSFPVDWAQLCPGSAVGDELQGGGGGWQRLSSIHKYLQ